MALGDYFCAFHSIAAVWKAATAPKNVAAYTMNLGTGTNHTAIPSARRATKSRMVRPFANGFVTLLIIFVFVVLVFLAIDFSFLFNL
nr:MAG TPA: hypothetical protein [Caudoviricetes sp.]